MRLAALGSVCLEASYVYNTKPAVSKTCPMRKKSEGSGDVNAF